MCGILLLEFKFEFSIYLLIFSYSTMEAISAGSAPFGSEMGGARRTRTEEDYFNSDDEEEEAVKNDNNSMEFCGPICVMYRLSELKQKEEEQRRGQPPPRRDAAEEIER